MAANNFIQGNLIGTSAAGLAAIGNDLGSVVVDSAVDTTGGSHEEVAHRRGQTFGERGARHVRTLIHLGNTDLTGE